mgnify:CR=1 FL=1
MHLVPDPKVSFAAFFVRDRRKTAMRTLVAHHGIDWLKLKHAEGVRGCVVFDIDDTIINGNDAVTNGFDAMRVLLQEATLLKFPVRIVTARPDDPKSVTDAVSMLRKRGFNVPASMVHYLPAHLWGKDTRHVEDFKWQKHLDFVKEHGAVIARFGDKLWDVAHRDSLRTYLGHVDDKDCYIFFDPRLGGTLSGKLPGLA